MRINVYIRQPASDLDPGAVVDTERHGPLVVDEVRKTFDADGVGQVDVYGRPPESPDGKRRRARYDIADDALVIPSEAEQVVAWNALQSAVELAVEEYDEDAAPLWNIDGARIKVQLDAGPTVVTFDAVSAYPPEAKPAEPVDPDGWEYPEGDQPEGGDGEPLDEPQPATPAE